MQSTHPHPPTEVEQHVLEIVTEAIPKLEHGIDYTSAAIFPADVWASLTAGGHISIGLALSRLVDQRRVSLEKSSPPYKMPVTYRRL